MPKLVLKKNVRRILITSVAAVIIIAASVTYSAQKTKVAAIKANIEELENRKKTTLDEIEYYERLIEYTKSDEFIEQYARDKLGWIKRDEIIFKDTTP